MVVESVRVHMLSSQHVVILKESDRERYLPIWIGPSEANAIAMRLQGLNAERPLTHDLLVSVVAALNSSISRVVVTHVTDGTFHARLYVETSDGGEAEIDALTAGVAQEIEEAIAFANAYAPEHLSLACDGAAAKISAQRKIVAGLEAGVRAVVQPGGSIRTHSVSQRLHRQTPLKIGFNFPALLR